MAGDDDSYEAAEWIKNQRRRVMRHRGLRRRLRLRGEHLWHRAEPRRRSFWRACPDGKQRQAVENKLGEAAALFVCAHYDLMLLASSGARGGDGSERKEQRLGALAAVAGVGGAYISRTPLARLTATRRLWNRSPRGSCRFRRSSTRGVRRRRRLERRIARSREPATPLIGPAARAWSRSKVQERR